jgi:hypothetical protein
MEKRYCVGRKNPRKWYELHDAGESAWFETAKIIVCGISKRNEFAYDERGIYYCLDSAFFIVPKEAIDLKYLLGLLNSHLLEFYFKHIATIKSGGYYEYRSQFLDRFPILVFFRYFSAAFLHSIACFLLGVGKPFTT